MHEPVKLLTIAGSDSGGAAGLQADLKTWTALGAYGMSAITAVTAQNSARVSGIAYMTPAFVAQQIDAVLSDYGAAAVKTGFLGRVDIITAVALVLRRWQPDHVVVDPVLVDHTGRELFGPEVTAAYRDQLLPLATLVTPNRREAALLAGQSAPADSPAVAGRLLQLGARAVLLKGAGAEAAQVDWLVSGATAVAFPVDAIATPNTHGSGDTLSAAIAAYLASGLDLETAVARARQFTHAAIARAATWRLGAGHGPLAHSAHVLTGSSDR